MPNKQKLPDNFRRKSEVKREVEKYEVSKKKKLRIYFKVDTFNDNNIYQSIKKYGFNSNKHFKQIEEVTIMHARNQKLGKIKTPCKISMTWFIPSKRSDVINFSIKQIIDALVSNGNLENDNVNHIFKRGGDDFIVVDNINDEGVEILFES